MKKINPISFFATLLIALLLASCNNKEDSPVIRDTPQSTTVDFSKVEIQDFIWKGLNYYYLWKDNVPNLANTKTDDSEAYFNLLNSKSDPEDFFESLIYNRQNVDKWSWIVDDYIALEQSFQGISKSNGVDFRLMYESGSNNDIFGYVRYIMPDSDASTKDVQRGYIFDAINGQQLTIGNYRSLLFDNDTYTMNFADLNGGNPVSNGKSVELTSVEYQENPVYIAKTLDIEGTKIAYLMYNGFTSSFDQQLNAAFAQFIADGATELILDLRYNSGGSVRTSTYLASMITGQFYDELFAKERWNDEIQEWYETNQPTWIENRFLNEIVKHNQNDEVVLQESINSLNLTNVYVLTTGSSASASELIINGLNPYINVVTIGTTTSGKYTGSITLYDSENFGRENANPNHTWAMQPIVLETVNKLGENDKDGFDPTIEVNESLNNFGVLGEITEPLLATAIAQITGTGKTATTKKDAVLLNKFVPEKPFSLTEGNMYIDKKLPDELVKKFKKQY